MDCYTVRVFAKVPKLREISWIRPGFKRCIERTIFSCFVVNPAAELQHSSEFFVVNTGVALNRMPRGWSHYHMEESAGSAQQWMRFCISLLTTASGPWEDVLWRSVSRLKAPEGLEFALITVATQNRCRPRALSAVRVDIKVKPILPTATSWFVVWVSRSLFTM